MWAPRSAGACPEIDALGRAARDDETILDPDVGERRRRSRDRHDAPARRAQSLGDRAAIVVVDADQRDVGARDQALLDRGVILHRPVPVEVIGRQIDQRADRRLERRREIDLERRAFDDMDARKRRGRQIEDRHADVAAHRDVAPRFAKDVGDQRGGRRLAIGAGDRDQRRVRRAGGALARVELDVADDGDAGGRSLVDRPMRLGMSERHARRENKCSEAAPVGGGKIDRREARRDGALARLRVVVPGRDFGAAGNERAERRQARAAEAEQRDAPTAKGLDRRHRHLSFSVARPIIASTKAMIQKRMTICGSDQPSCSK